VKEETAKTKWCPFARQMVSLQKGNIPETTFAIASANRFKDDVMASCLGSGCMAWRGEKGEPGHGYCGLAGRPER